ncbi:hypothetical protein [Mesorhizobium sp.]|uniref:hypothetical protein n=1 Tax=Mesorhizobium sp. TaxID=1871066 RepID=UPI00257D1027|nr:hypothetical protein [Mesorhizobium sp.]
MDQTVADLVERSAEANSALMRGEITKYYEVTPHTGDFLLMSPFGGKPTRAAELTAERIEAMGRFFKNGTFEHELLQAYGSADMVVLAIIERPHVKGRRSASPGLAAAGYLGLSPRRGGMALGASAR